MKSQTMFKKSLSIAFVVIVFIVCIFIYAPNRKTHIITSVQSPCDFRINNQSYKISDYECFDTSYSERNKRLAKSLNITEFDAFVIGNLGKYWAINNLQNRKIRLDKNGEIYYLKYNYKNKFKNSGFCIDNEKPCSKYAFNRILSDINKGKYKVLDLDSGNVFTPEEIKNKKLTNFLVIKQRHLPYKIKGIKLKKEKDIIFPQKQAVSVFSKGNIKVILSDFTENIIPNRSCNGNICKEILYNINNAQTSIDMAIYGYSRVPELENALKNAQKRGVKIRLIYDSNANGENIYPDTPLLVNLLKNSISDIKSPDVKNIMHNKFYIFDDSILITGSANLSHTDMSEYNTNSVIVIKSKEVAKFYKAEFEQMYSGRFHSEKTSAQNKSVNNLKIYFSPQDKGTTNALLPLINNAQKYIYIPIFVLTDAKISNALINAKSRGVDVKIIMDALNPSTNHSKHKELRQGGIELKVENYAGKMHSKSMIIDDKYTVIGSMNFSYSGENKNDENMIVIEDSDIAKFYKKFFIYQWFKIDNKWLTRNPRAEGVSSIGSCTDGIDNNYDGKIDKDDDGCVKYKY